MNAYSGSSTPRRENADSSRRSGGHTTRSHWNRYGALLVLLSVSWILRVVLVLRGGQGFFSDEGRYLRAWKLLRFLLDSEWGGALDSLSNGAAHNGFTILSLPAAAAQLVTIRLLGLPEDLDSILATAWLPALLLSPVSVVSVWLTYAVARRAGAGQREGLTAALLMSCAASMLYYARHLFSYDAAMALALCALWLALGRGTRFASFVLCGIVAASAFMTYNGYWTVVLIVLAIRVLYRADSVPAIAKRALGAGLGFAALPALLTIASVARNIQSYATRMTRFSQNVTQGDFAEGWRLPWEYLWHAEHGLLLVLLIGVSGTLWLCTRRAEPARTRALLWLGATGSLYLLLALFSTGLERFVVAGRLARQLVPFLCLASACGLFHLVREHRLGKTVVGVGLSLLVLQTAFNFAPLFRMQFPSDVSAEVMSRLGAVNLGTTLAGRVHGATPEVRASRYVLLNVQRVAPIEGVRVAPAGREMFRIPHPFEYLPYQYDVGGGPRVRAILRSTDISMRLIDTRRRERTDPD
jgi:hypothetical protein